MTLSLRARALLALAVAAAVPPLVEASEAGEAFWFGLHDILTKVLMALVTIHMLGAFKREMEGDGTLTRMIRGSAR